jgi:hypothetical protein
MFMNHALVAIAFDADFALDMLIVRVDYSVTVNTKFIVRFLAATVSHNLVFNFISF